MCFLSTTFPNAPAHRPPPPPYFLTSPLSRIRNQVKTVRINTFCAQHVKEHINNYFASFDPQVLLLFLKEVEKTCLFTQKWLDHLPFLSSLLRANTCVASQFN